MVDTTIENSSDATKSVIRDLIPQYRGNEMVLLGDSITTLCQYQNNTTYYRVLPRAWIIYAMTKLVGRARVLDVSAVNGDKIAQAKVRIPDVIALNPDYVVCMVGINDANSWATQQQYIDAWIEYRDEILAPLTKAGITAVACTLPPAQTINSALRKTGWHYFNAKLRDHDLGNRSILLADLAANTYSDFATDGTQPLAGFTVDGLHPDVSGAQLIGSEVSRAISPELLEGVTNASVEGDEFNFATDVGHVINVSKTGGSLAGTPTPTGTAPTGLTLRGLCTNSTGVTIVGSVVPSTDGGSDWAEIVLSGTGMASQTNIAYAVEGGQQALIDIVDGDWVEFGFEYDITALDITGANAGLIAINTRINFFGTSGFQLNYFPRALNGEGELIDAQSYNYVKSVPLFVPPGTTGMQLNMEARHQGSSTDVSSTIRFRNPFIRKIENFDNNNSIVQP